MEDLGLEQSIQTLLHATQAQSPGIRLTASIDPRLNGVDALLSQTTYRVIQEGLTNVLRHARASQMDVSAEIAGAEVAIEISDDGIGISDENGFGRGLTGMRERVRALDGSFEILRCQGRTRVRCRLPLEHGSSS